MTQVKEVQLQNLARADNLIHSADDSAFETFMGSSAVAGWKYYNTSSNVIRFYNGSAWGDLGGGGGSAGRSITHSFFLSGYNPQSTTPTGMPNVLGIENFGRISGAGGRVVDFVVEATNLSALSPGVTFKPTLNGSVFGDTSYNLVLDNSDLNKFKFRAKSIAYDSASAFAVTESTDNAHGVGIQVTGDASNSPGFLNLYGTIVVQFP